MKSSLFIGLPIGLAFAAAGYALLDNPAPAPVRIPAKAASPADPNATASDSQADRHGLDRLVDASRENKTAVTFVSNRSAAFQPQDYPSQTSASSLSVSDGNTAAGQYQTADASALKAEPPAFEFPLRQPSVPLAFQPLPADAAKANPQLADALRDLQQNFVDALGGPNQDPNAPAYYQKWVAAQTNIDEQYRILVGNQAFLAEQMSVNNQ